MRDFTMWVAAVIVVIFVAELIAGRHRGVYGRNDWFVNPICIVFGVAGRPLGAGLIALAVGLALPRWHNALAWVPFWPALITIILTGELANYGVHRAAHEAKGSRWFDWLWRMHRTHHTGKYVNVLLNYRTSLFWVLVGGLAWVFALAIYLGQGKAAGVGVAVFSFWGIITHADFRWDDAVRRHPRFGPVFRALEHVLISPGVHHSHHGYGRDGGNFRNFGVMLAIYDWMFGTLHIPQGRPQRYGLPGDTPHWANDAFSPLNLGDWLGRAPGAEAEGS